MTTVACPRCGRKLRLPDGVAGQAVQCPACKATFEATAPHEVLSDPPRVAPPEPDDDQHQPLWEYARLDLPTPPKPDPAPDQAQTTRWSGFGSWSAVRRGLGWIMVDQGIVLVVLSLDLLLAVLFFLNQLARGSVFDFVAAPWFGWSVPSICCVRMLVMLVAGVCMLVGLGECQRYPVPGPAPGVATAAFGAYLIAYLLRMACPSTHLPSLYLMEVFHWELGFFLLLLPRWVSEALLIRFLYLLGRDWRDEPTMARLRWLIALLVADVVLHLGLVTGMNEWCEDVADMHFFGDPLWFGLLSWVGRLALYLAMTALLLRVLIGLRGTLAPPQAAPDPE